MQSLDVLTEERIASYAKEGYLVLPNFWDEATVARLLTSIRSIVAGFDIDDISMFSTDEQTRTSDDYFLTSGDKVRAFFEPKAFAFTNGKNVLTVDKATAINKVGHNLHELDPGFRAVSLEDPRIATILRQLGYEHPAVPQSMAILKNGRVGGPVHPHVDGAFLFTSPQSVIGFWWPLEDCTQDNGCLWAVPGSHSRGVNRRFKRNSAGTGTEFEPPEAEEFDISGAVPLETPAGSLVLIHSSLVHYSEGNMSDRSRHAYSIHVIETGKGVEYPGDNWLQRSDGKPFPTLY